MMATGPRIMVDRRDARGAPHGIGAPVAYSLAPNKPNFMRFPAENAGRATKQTQLGPSRTARENPALAVSSSVQNKANFRGFSAKNGDWAEKQSQSNPIPRPSVGSFVMLRRY